MARKILVGQDVRDAQLARKHAALGVRDTYPSEPLCAWQIAESRRGIIEAELVESFRGWTVRYASGLQNFGLIAGVRRGDLDGSYEAALAFATAWQAADPERRFVSISILER